MLRMPLRSISARCAVIFFTAVASPAAPQAIDVRVITQGSGAPSSGSVVLALDSLGSVVASGVTTDGGRVLRLPYHGLWRIRVEHLGFGTAGRHVEVPEGRIVPVEIVLRPSPILLDGIDVATESLCGPESLGAEVPELWSAARSLLASAGATSGRERRFRVATRLLRMESGAYYHKEDLRDGDFEYDRAADVEHDTTWVDGESAFPVEDPKRILQEGFILPSYPGAEEAYVFDFHAPHPQLILSDNFIATHCFKVVRGEEDDDAHAGMVGLAFEPNRAPLLEYDVSGVMWLPESVDRWPWIDFRWTRIPEEGEIRDYSVQPYDKGGRREASEWLATIAENDDRFGGRLDLAQIPGVGWIVNRFQIQWPEVRREWAVHLKADAVEKAYTPERIRPGDLMQSRWWILFEVNELVGEVISVQVDGGGR